MSIEHTHSTLLVHFRALWLWQVVVGVGVRAVRYRMRHGMVQGLGGRVHAARYRRRVADWVGAATVHTVWVCR